MSEGIDRVKNLIDEANDVLVKGEAIVKDSETAWTDIQKVLEEGTENYNCAVAKYDALKKKWGEGDIGSRIMASLEATKEIKVIIEEVNHIKDKVFEIYDKIKVIKDNAHEVLDALKHVLAELSKWRRIKKEIEEQLHEAKLEILEAVASCKKLAGKKCRSTGELDGLAAYFKKLDLKKIDATLKNHVIARFENVMSSCDLFTSRGKNQTEKGVVDDLTHLLDNALSYAERSQSWQKLEELEHCLNELQSTLDTLINDKADEEAEKSKSLSKLLKNILDKLIASSGDKASELLGDLIEPVGPAFDLVGKFLGKVANLSITEVKGKLPKEFEGEFLDWKGELFSHKVTVPVASLGWINLFVEFGLKSEAEFKVSGSVKIFDVFKPEQPKILHCSLTSSGQVSLTGSVSLVASLLNFLEARLTASLTAASIVKEATTTIDILKELSAEAKHGTVVLNAKSILAFELVGKLTFTVGLTPLQRDLVEQATQTRPRPIVEWKLGEMLLFTVETTKNFSMTLRVDSVELSFNEVIALLRDSSAYRLATAGHKCIEQSMSDHLGHRKMWEQYVGAGRLTEDVMNQLREKYRTTE